MNRINKFALLTGSLVILTTLSACQSTTPSDHSAWSKRGHGHSMRHHGEMSAEQKQRWQQHQAERQQLAQQRIQVCAGKSAGDSVQLQYHDKLKTGQCQVSFKMDENSKIQLRQILTAAKQVQHQDRNTLTAEQRDQLQQLRNQKHAGRKALQQQLQAACQGQPAGKKVNVQYAEQTLQGQCVLQYQNERFNKA